MLLEIPRYKGYRISDTGEVYSLKSKRYLKPKTDKYGYLVYTLSVEGKPKCITAHRLVAMAYISNPNELPCVNHINEDKTDNRVINLEWTTVKDNDNHGTRNSRMARTKETKPVMQILRDGTTQIFRGAKDAWRQTGINRCQISRACRGLSKSAGGCEWRYINE